MSIAMQGWCLPVAGKTTAMVEEKLIQRGWRGWLALFGLWALFSVFNSSNVQLMQYAAGRKYDILAVFLNDQIILFLIFAALCPLVYRYSFKYSPSRSGWVSALLFNGIMLAVIFIAIVAVSALYTYFFHSPGKELVAICKMQFTGKAFLMRVYSAIVSYLLVFGSMTVLRWNRQKREQKELAKKLEIQTSQLESQLANAKLQTLKQQLQPHFLFNALNSISSLVENKKNEQAFKTIAQLSDLLRTSLDLPDIQTIPLRREMDFVQKYLAIELVRFPDRLKVEMEVDRRCENALIPPLILQPLVENCIRHGVAKQPRPVLISVGVKKIEEKIRIDILNDRSRLPEGWSLDAHRGVGIQNVMERLKTVYHNKYTFEIRSIEPQGVRVTMILPYQVRTTPRGSGKHTDED
jgi:sensor histidine kinase YesM